MRILVFLFAVCFFLSGSEDLSAKTAHHWLVQKVTGQAWFAAKGQKPARVKRGMYLAPGQTLSTKKRARVLLIRGREHIKVGANAIMALPPAKYMRKGKTTILHQAGVIDFKVNKRDVRHFSVKTPYLAAVVKGTRFTVSVANGRAEVNVSAGKVGVSSHVSGESADITPGQSASVDVKQSARPTLSIRAKAGAKQKVRIKKVKEAKKVAPAFRATVKVKGKKRELATGSAKNLLSKKQQAVKEAARLERRKQRAAKKMSRKERKKQRLAKQAAQKRLEKQTQLAPAIEDMNAQTALVAETTRQGRKNRWTAKRQERRDKWAARAADRREQKSAEGKRKRRGFLSSLFGGRSGNRSRSASISDVSNNSHFSAANSIVGDNDTDPNGSARANVEVASVQTNSNSASTSSSNTSSSNTSSSNTSSSNTSSSNTSSSNTSSSNTSNSNTSSSNTSSSNSSNSSSNSSNSDNSNNGGSWTGPLGGTITWDGNGNSTYTSPNGNTYDLGGNHRW